MPGGSLRKLGWKHDDISRYKVALERAWKKKMQKEKKVKTDWKFWLFSSFNYLVFGPSIIVSPFSLADDSAGAKRSVRCSLHLNINRGSKRARVYEPHTTMQIRKSLDNGGGPIQSTGSATIAIIGSILRSLPFYCLSAGWERCSSKLRPESSDAISSSFLKTRYCRGIITGMYAVLNSQTMGYTLMQGHEITLHSEQGWLDSRAENKFWRKFNAFYKLCRRDPFYSPRLQLSFMKTSNNATFLNCLVSNCHLSLFSAVHVLLVIPRVTCLLVPGVSQLAGPDW